MLNNRQNIAVKKWLPVAHSPLDKSHRNKKKRDLSRELFAGSSGKSKNNSLQIKIQIGEVTFDHRRMIIN